MSRIDELILSIKRGETPATRLARDTYKKLVSFNVPVNALSAPIYSGIYRAWHFGEEAWELTRAKLLWEPMVRAKFAHVGKNLRLGRLPMVRGHARISVGDNVYMGAGICIESGRYLNEPILDIGSNVTIASDCYFMVSRQIIVGDYVSIGASCDITDGDGHHTDLEARKRNEPAPESDLQPVTLEEGCWLGRGVKVLKGVTVGRGAIIAAGSVVASDVPEGALAMGVPARVVRRG